MSELGLINLTIIILFLPLFGFGIVLFFGKKFPKIYLLEVGILITAFVLSLVVGFFKLSGYVDQNILFSFTWIDYRTVSASTDDGSAVANHHPGDAWVKSGFAGVCAPILRRKPAEFPSNIFLRKSLQTHDSVHVQW